MDFKIHFNIKYVHNKTYDQNLNCETLYERQKCC